MRAVWKYPLQIIDTPQRVLIPAGARLAHVNGQHDVPCLWFEVGSPGFEPVPASDEEHWVVVHGTGHPIDHDGVYVGTALTHGGDLVWHIFEVEGP